MTIVPFNQETANSYKNKFEDFKDKIDKNLITSTERVSAQNLVGDYYEYLAATGIKYGQAAYDVSQNQNAFGQFANDHLELSAIAQGKDPAKINDLKSNFIIELALSDADARLGNNSQINADLNGNISYSDIAQIHYDVLADKNIALDKTAWGGTFFEEFAGSGSWMDLGGYDSSVEVSQLGMFTALGDNITVNGVNAYDAFGALMETAWQNKDIASEAFGKGVMGSRGLNALINLSDGLREFDENHNSIIIKSSDKIKSIFNSFKENIFEPNGEVKKDLQSYYNDLTDDKNLLAYSIKDGDTGAIFANSGAIGTDAVYTDSNGNVTSQYSALFPIKDSEGKTIFTIVRDGFVALKDGTVASINTVISSIDHSAQATADFMLQNVQKSVEILIERVKSDQYLNSLIGNVISDILLGENDPKEIAKHLAEGELKNLASALLDSNVREALAQSGISQPTIDNLLGKPAAGYITNESGAIIPVDASGAPITTPSVQGTMYAAVLNFAIAAADSSGWNSAEYAQAAKVAIVSAIVSAVVTTVLTAVFPGVGTVAGIVISSVINALVVGPLVTYADDQYKIVEDAFIIARDLTKDVLTDPINTIEDLSVVDLANKINELAKDYIDNIGHLGANILISAYDLLGGHYGKELGSGQYWNPYSFIQVTPKPDGTGNNIIGIEPEGAVLIAAEGQNDDLYGTSGQDILIGKSGKNTILGYEGNDHIEGRGDNDILIGGDGNDEIQGGNGDDYISGGAGADLLEGGNGNDTILGGAGSDIIYGGKGDDQIQGDEGDDYIEGNEGSDTVLGGAGSDVIDGGDGDDIILGEDGDDIILAGGGSDLIDGGAGVDIIYCGAGNDNLKGGDGDDEIYGQEGTDIIYGDAGSDLINAGRGDDLVFGGLGNDIIYGAAGDDSLSGEFGNDYLLGGAGNDTLDGGEGDDVIFGGAGNDEVTGGNGNDTFIFLAGNGQDVINDSDEAGSDVIKLTDLSSTIASGANRLVLTKSANDLIVKFKNEAGEITEDKITVKNQFLDEDSSATTLKIDRIEFADGKKIELQNAVINGDNTLTYTTASYANIDTAIQSELAQGYQDNFENSDQDELVEQSQSSTFYSNNYDTTANQDQIDNEKINEVQWQSHKKKRSIFGGVYTVWEKYYEQNLSGTNGNDRIIGNWWSENISGGAGDDQLSGNDGNDTIYGGAGDDLIYGGSGQDALFGEEGNDKIYGGSENDNISGGAGSDYLIGGAGNDIVSGDEGDDKLEGDEGDDQINGGVGRDIIMAGAGADTINGGADADRIEGNDDNDIIVDLEGNNLIYGNGGGDSITSGAGNDRIYGQAGVDSIKAGAGDDFVSGGADSDVIYGEDGNDILYGDLGDDIIDGGAGNDAIYGGAGVDLIYAQAGNDIVAAGTGEDWVEAGSGNDTASGGMGSDKIYGQDGDDILSGNEDGDVLDGGAGSDIINGGEGNDILVDGAGSDALDGGVGNDIIILTKEDSASTSIDVINNFNADEDKVILKVNYQHPITFSAIKAALVQNGDDAQVALNNGQQIIFKNTLTTAITENNFQIGLSGGANNDILFGEDGNDVVFGDEGDDIIYGGAGNDELWGGKGADALYGESGDDVLRYEADGKYSEQATLNYSDEVVRYWGYSHRYVHPAHFFDNLYSTYIYSPAVGSSGAATGINSSSDVFISSYDYLSRQKISENYIARADAQSKNVPYPSSWVFDIFSINKITYQYDALAHFATKNFYSGQATSIDGYNRTYDIFDGGAGYDAIVMTEGNDVLTLDDPTSAKQTDGPRVKDIAAVYAGAGNDVINFSTTKYSYGDFVVYGGAGDDKIWSSSGNDTLFGQDGNDEIYGGAGNDVIDGGDGVDKLYGGDGDDVIIGGLGNIQVEGGAHVISGDNKIFGGNGNDLIIGGAGADYIDGGAGSNTVSYEDSAAAINIDLRTLNEIRLSQNSGSSAPTIVTLEIQSASTVQGGDAQGDTLYGISNIVGSTYNDTLVGNAGSNTFTGGAGNDILMGGKGSDTYIYNLNDGTDTITETAYDFDIIKFGAGISKNDISFSSDGNDSIIQVGNDSQNKIIIKNQNISSGEAKIEQLKFYNGDIIDLSGVSAGSEDSSSIKITDNYSASGGALSGSSSTTNSSTVALSLASVSLSTQTKTYAATASHGTATISADGNINYTPNHNFSGVDQVIYQVLGDGVNILYSKTYNIFVTASNDAPTATQIADRNIILEENFTIKLSDYFADVDSDNLEYSVMLNGSNQLPDWIEFNPATNIISGTPGKVQELNFEITASDKKGGFVTDKFTINVAQNSISGANNEVVQNLGNLANLPSLKSLTFVTKEGLDYNEKISAGDENNFITANKGDDKIYSAGGVDIIDGGEGNDLISAGNGDDILIGGSGSNHLIGGLGNDTYIFKSAENSNNIIEDNNGQIIIDGQKLAATAQQIGDSNIYTSGNINFIKEGADLKFSYADSAAVTIKNFANKNFGITLNDNLQTNEDQKLIISKANLLQQSGLDSSEFTIKYFNNAIQGNIMSKGGDVIFTPFSNRNGIGGFTFDAVDKNGVVTRHSVGVNIAAVNDAPVAQNDSFALNTNRSLAIKFSKILLNDKDVEDGSLIKNISAENIVFETHANGSITKLGDSIIYTPNKNFFGIDQIFYSIKDSSGALSNKAAINLQVDVKAINVGANNAPLSAILNNADFLNGDGRDNIFTYKSDFKYANDAAKIINPYTGDQASIAGKAGTLDGFDGKAGNDTLNFASGSDVFILDDTSKKFSSIEIINSNGGNDVIDLASNKLTYGNVIINGGNGSEALWGNDGDDVINGNNGNDNIVGGRGNDALNGGAGRDTIKGFDGNDVINGGGGSDILGGGLGNDIFIFTSLEDSRINASDLITDFTKDEDKIDFSALGFAGIGNETPANDNILSYHFDHNQTIIENHDGSFVVKLSGQVSLTNDDFNFG